MSILIFGDDLVEWFKIACWQIRASQEHWKWEVIVWQDQRQSKHVQTTRDTKRWRHFQINLVRRSHCFQSNHPHCIAFSTPWKQVVGKRGATMSFFVFYVFSTCTLETWLRKSYLRPSFQTFQFSSVKTLKLEAEKSQLNMQFWKAWSVRPVLCSNKDVCSQQHFLMARHDWTQSEDQVKHLYLHLAVCVCVRCVTFTLAVLEYMFFFVSAFSKRLFS